MSFSKSEAALLEFVPCCVSTGSAIRDESGTIIDFLVEYVNAAGRSMFPGLPAIPYRWSSALPEARSGKMFQFFAEVVESGAPFIRDLADRGALSERWEAVFADIKVEKRGDGYLVAWRNVAREHALVRELTTSRQLLADVLKLADQPVGRADHLGKLVWCNDTYLKLAGEPRLEDAVGKPVWELFQTIAVARDSDPADLRLLRLAKHLEDHDVHHLIGEFGNRFGETRHMEWISRAIRDEAGGVVEYQFVGSDITKWQESTSTLRDINKVLAKARELERQSLAARLHDGALQHLMAATWGLDESALGSEAFSHIKTAIDAVRLLLQEIIPSSGHLELLEALIQDDVAALRASGVEVCVSLQQPPTEAATVLATRLLHVVLQNVLAHARASVADVVVAVDGDWVLITVKDDGRGFDEAEAERAAADGRLSLVSINALIDSNNGTFSIKPTSTGSIVKARIPSHMDIFQ